MAALADDLPLLPSNHRLVRDNAEHTVRQTLSTSIVCYSLVLAVTLMKLISEVTIISFFETSTSKPLVVWIIGCLALDFASLVMQLCKLPYIKRLHQGEFFQEPCLLSTCCKMISLLEIGWQVPGNLWYWRCEDCYHEAEALTVLVFVLLVFGYINMLLPALIIASVCACLPVMIVIMMFLNNPQTLASEAVIAQIKAHEFDPKKHRGESCSICRGEYSPRESVVALKCDERHMFHEECVKKWLQINANCPICRAAIS